MNSVQRKSSRESTDPLAVSSSAGRSNTPVPLPRMPVMLGTLASGRRSDYQETPVIHDEKPAAPGGAGSSTIAPDVSSEGRKRTAVKETPVPLPPRIPQRQAIQVTPNPAQPSGTPQTPGTSKRGRPKGWRPGMSYAAVRGVMPSGAKPVKKIRPAAAAAGEGIKRRGRPPKQPSPPPVELYHRQNALFIAFLCEWTGCKAELHNLDTLRRHIRAVHLRPLKGPGQKCRWARCGQTMGKEFARTKELESHVEERHLVPFSWHIGDGPQNSSGMRGPGGDEDVPFYLKDADGNQVTPSIKGQVVEDYATWRCNRKKLKQLLLERDRNLPSEDEESPVGEEEGAS